MLIYYVFMVMSAICIKINRYNEKKKCLKNGILWDRFFCVTRAPGGVHEGITVLHNAAIMLQFILPFALNGLWAIMVTLFDK